jgi:hypothetical protein
MQIGALGLPSTMTSRPNEPTAKDQPSSETSKLRPSPLADRGKSPSPALPTSASLLAASNSHENEQKHYGERNDLFSPLPMVRQRASACRPSTKKPVSLFKKKPRINFDGRNDAPCDNWHKKRQRDDRQDRMKKQFNGAKNKPPRPQTRRSAAQAACIGKGESSCTDGDGPSVQPASRKGKTQKDEKAAPECSNCNLGLACTMHSHWHWANNKGKGDHPPAKVRIMRKKPRAAVICKYTALHDGAVCPDHGDHCHPVNAATRKANDALRIEAVQAQFTLDDAEFANHTPEPTRYHEESKDAAVQGPLDEVDTLVANINNPNTKAKVAVVKKTTPKSKPQTEAVTQISAAVLVAMANSHCNPAMQSGLTSENSSYSPGTLHVDSSRLTLPPHVAAAVRGINFTRIKPVSAVTPQVTKQTCTERKHHEPEADDGGPPAVDNENLLLREIRAFRSSTLQQVRPLGAYTRALPRRGATFNRDIRRAYQRHVNRLYSARQTARINDISPPSKSVTFAVDPPVEVGNAAADPDLDTELTIIFYNAIGQEPKRWRTPSEFTGDCAFWLRTHVSCVNEDYVQEEDEQVTTSAPIVSRKVNKWRMPTIWFDRERPLGINYGMTKPTVVRERTTDEVCNLFDGIYTRSRKVRVFTKLFNLLLTEKKIMGKVVLDTDNRLRSTYTQRIEKMLTEEYPELTTKWISTPQNQWIYRHTLARFVNHAVIAARFDHQYGDNHRLTISVDKPMLNGSRVLSSLSQKSKNHTA